MEYSKIYECDYCKRLFTIQDKLKILTIYNERFRKSLNYMLCDKCNKLFDNYMADFLIKFKDSNIDKELD
jgi:hypothetical protein